MSRPIIEVRDLSKRYRLGTIGATSLRDEAERLWASLRGRAVAPDQRDLWALKDVSFDVQAGEVLGVIGRNGAGKSTLLKILSRITEPTSGHAVLRGRVASLLEVGTGFHPELTGRENVYLNGAIFGMKRREITARFDEITAFAEIEKFIDTPVKRYSSGMYVRLAFAVAAHLDPEILIVDEVLAVGDIEFQEKCLGKIKDVAHSGGRTVLFVSHNLGAITGFCERVLTLDGGVSLGVREAHAGVDVFLNTLAARSEPSAKFAKGPGLATAEEIRLSGPDGKPTTHFKCTDSIHIELEYEVRTATKNLEILIEVFNHLGAKIFYTALTHVSSVLAYHEAGEYRAEVTLPEHFLTPGRYSLTVSLAEPNVCYYDQRFHALSFYILETGSRDYKYANTDIGSVFVNLPWKRRERDAAA